MDDFKDAGRRALWHEITRLRQDRTQVAVFFESPGAVRRAASANRTGDQEVS